MLILNQLRNKIVNVDAVESIEVEYNTGSSYTVVKAVVEHPWDSEEFPTKKTTIALGEYSTSVKAEEVIKWIYTANLAESRGFKMPKDGEVDAGF